MFIGLTTSCETMSIEISDSTNYMKKPIIFPILTFKGFVLCIFEYGHFGFVVRLWRYDKYGYNSQNHNTN